MKKLTYTIVFLILLATVLYLFSSNLENSEILKLSNGEVVKIQNIDENIGEDIIIKSDKSEYKSPTSAEIYLSVAGGKTDETKFVQFLFPIDGSKIEKVEIKNGDVWEPLVVSSGSIESSHSDEIIEAIKKQKGIPETHSSIGFVSLINTTGTSILRLTISYPEKTMGEFWVEAFGNKGSYGLLDPSYGYDPTLVGYWKFDEGSGNVTGDSSGNNNTGSITGATWTSGKLGKALNFTSSQNNYVNLGQPVSLQITGAMTISAWVKQASLTDYNQIVSKAASSGQRGWGLRCSSSNTTCEFHIASDTDTQIHVGSDTSGISKTGVWMHLVGVYTPSVSLEIYKDGVLVERDIASIPASQFDQAVNASIGSRSNASLFFDGSIDDVRIYNRALSGTEVVKLYKSGVTKLYKTGTAKINSSQVGKIKDGLIGYWTFDGKDLSGTNAYDRSPVGTNTGTITGAVTTIGKAGQALKFDGTSAYVSSGNVSNSLRTITFWIKTPGTADTTYFKGNLDDIRFYNRVLSVSEIKQLYNMVGTAPALSSASPTAKILDLDGGTTYVDVVNGTITPHNFSGTIYVDGVVSSTIDDSWRFVVITTDSTVNASAVAMGRVGSPSLVVTDDFLGSANPLGGDWTTAVGTSAMKKVSNEAGGSAPNATNAAYWNANVFNNDQYAQIKALGWGGGGYDSPGVILRHNGSDFYTVYVNYNASRIYFTRYNGGAYTNVGGTSYTTYTFTAGHTLRAEIVGNVITAYDDGGVISTRTVTGADIISSGSPGLYCYSGDTTMRIDDFEAGDL
ncbi:MAG: LamG domain-containing protein [Patescibacteria group bacterium]